MSAILLMLIAILILYKKLIRIENPKNMQNSYCRLSLKN